MDSLKTFKPSDVDISNYLIGSDLKVSEYETLACNIIDISLIKNEWLPFSFKEYSELCDCEASNDDRVMLDLFVKKNLLTFEDDKYLVTLKMLEIYSDFLK